MQEETIIAVFIHLRRENLPLGLRELRDALRIVRADYAPAQVSESLQLLWSSSEAERALIRKLLADYAAREARAGTPPAPPPQTTPPPVDRKLETGEAPQITEPPAPRPDPDPVDVQDEAEMGVMPVRAPYQRFYEETRDPLFAYYPISRRAMMYAWRYLRRPVADGPADVLDIPATIARVIREGFFLEPVYRRRERNDARLVIFADQGGSMTPFHRYVRDLTETARYESRLEEDHVAVYYFKNVPEESVGLNTRRTERVPLAEVLRTIDNETSVLIVSDAGAARGPHRDRKQRQERVRDTLRFLRQLRQRTGLIAWLNPMPRHPDDRWLGTAAEYIAASVPMFQMDPDGFSNAIDALRGQVAVAGY